MLSVSQQRRHRFSGDASLISRSRLRARLSPRVFVPSPKSTGVRCRKKQPRIALSKTGEVEQEEKRDGGTLIGRPRTDTDTESGSRDRESVSPHLETLSVPAYLGVYLSFFTKRGTLSFLRPLLMVMPYTVTGYHSKKTRLQLSLHVAVLQEHVCLCPFSACHPSLSSRVDFILSSRSRIMVVSEHRGNSAPFAQCLEGVSSKEKNQRAVGMGLISLCPLFDAALLQAGLTAPNRPMTRRQEWRRRT